KGLRSQLQQLQPIFIPVEIDSSKFNEQIKKLSANIDPIKIDLAPNVKDFQEKLKRIGRITPIDVEIRADKGAIKAQFTEIGRHAAEGFTQGFSGAEDAGKSAVDSMVRSVKSQLGIQSPSKVFREIGKYATLGLMQGLDSVDESKLKGVVNKVESYFKNSKIKINLDIDGNKSPLKEKTKVTLDADSIEGDISKAVEKGVRGASSKNIFAVLTGGLLKAAVGIGSGLLGVILLPLKAASLALGTIFAGAGLKLGEELSSGISSGIKSAIGSALSDSIGSSSIVGEAIGEGVVESLGLAFKKLVPGLMQEVAEQARLVLGEEKVFTASAVRRSQSSTSALKDKQTATEQVQSDYERASKQGKPARLKQLGTEIGAVLPGIRQDSQTFAADYTSEQQRLQKIAERFKVKLTPERLIKKRIKEYEQQVKTFEKLAASLEAQGEAPKANRIRSAVAAIPRPDTDPSKISTKELQFQEAKYLAGIQGKFVNRELNKQFSSRRAELAQRKKAIAPQMQEYEQLSQELGGIGRASEVLGVAPSISKKTQKDNLPAAYQKIFQQVAALSGVGEIPAGMIPQLASSSKLKPGVLGSYAPESNRVNVPPEVYQLIQKGQLNQQIIDTLVHELRHALQFGLGKVNPLAGESAAIPLATPTQQEARQFGKLIEGSTSIQPEQARTVTRKLESDAYVFAARNTPKIAAQFQKESAVEQFQKAFGVAGANAEKLLKNLQIESIKKIQPIQGLVQQYGATLEGEITQVFAQFENLSKSLEPLLNKAANIESLTAEEITQLQQELGSSLSAVIAQIEAVPAELKKVAIAKVQSSKKSAPLSEAELLKQTTEAQASITANLKQSFKGKPRDRKVVNQDLAAATLTEIDNQIALATEQLNRGDLSGQARQKLGQFKGTLERQYRTYSPALRASQPGSNQQFKAQTIQNNQQSQGVELFAVSDDIENTLASAKAQLLKLVSQAKNGKQNSSAYGDFYGRQIAQAEARMEAEAKVQEAKAKIAFAQTKKEMEAAKRLLEQAEAQKKVIEQTNARLKQLEEVNSANPSFRKDLLNADIATAEANAEQRRGKTVQEIRANPRQFFQQRSRSATVQKARYITENAEGIANLVGTKVGESPSVEQTKSLLNLQDAFGKVGEASAKFGQNQSNKNFLSLSAAIGELEGALRKLGIPFELINHEIDIYTNNLKKMQAEGKIDIDVNVSSLAPEKFSFIDNILSKFSGLELKGIKAIAGLVKGFLAIGAIAYIQNFFTELSVNAFKAYVELDRLKTALNFASGGSSGGAQNLAFVRKTVEDLKVPLKASTEGFVQLAAAAKGS
ncbi:MAG TPA: hypothetical protein VE944_32670, partial [Nostoc sp.]|uniref:hypothetical protein n=1 Tax=Nostoc sp. TaxID=1180 RepID=UPI002D42870F